MRFKRRHHAPHAEGDMTPMIDMTFQLIAFFMVLINFTEADQNERVKLPSSELAKPPEAPFEHPLTLNLTKQGSVLFGGDETTLDGLRPLLLRESQLLRLAGDSPADATIVIRADAEAPSGTVRKLMQTCQGEGFELFVLRAKQEET